LRQKGVLVEDVVDEVGGNPASLIAVDARTDSLGYMDTMMMDAVAEVGAYIEV
jgi:hypothetical protein